MARPGTFAGKQGIFCGDKIPNYPTGASSHSTEAWFRAEKPNATIIGWGNEGGGRGSKVRMQLRSPPHIHIDSDFSDVNGESTSADARMGSCRAHLQNGGWQDLYQWQARRRRMPEPPLNIKSPARLWIGGWYDNYDFVGDIDEVRISKVARSADWVQAAVREPEAPANRWSGPLVQAGQRVLGLGPEGRPCRRQERHAHREGRRCTEDLLDSSKRDGQETVAATDRFSFTFDAGRVVGDQSLTLQFKAIYADEVKTKDIPVTIKEDIPEPVFTLQAPASVGRPQDDRSRAADRQPERDAGRRARAS